MTEAMLDDAILGSQTTQYSNKRNYNFTDLMFIPRSPL